jgi:hypothetical protein
MFDLGLDVRNVWPELLKPVINQQETLLSELRISRVLTFPLKYFPP